MAGLVALTIGYVLSQFYRSFLAVLTPALTSELGATKAELSMASGAWFVVFALMQFVVGVSLDRYGPRRTAAFLLAACGGGGAVLFALAQTPWAVILAMALNGAGCSAVLMASVFIFAKTFSPARLAILISWLVAFGTLGNVIGSAPLAEAAEAFGWRWVMAGLAAVTILTGLAIGFLVRDPDPDPDVGPGRKGEGFGFRGYLELFRLRVLWPILPLTALNYAPAAGIRGLWAGPYLADVYGADALLIGQVTLFMALAMSVGSFVYGPLDVIFRTRKWVVFFGNGIGAAAVTWLALFPVPGIAATTILFVVIGVCGASYGLMMTHGRAFLPPHLTGRGVTLLNFFSVGGAGVMQFVTGGVVAAASAPGEPAAAYQTLFIFYAVLVVITLAIYLTCRDAPPETKRR
ncbi:MFS transporter [Nitratireductor sp. ZSWI3]|uniref:MFS transporter n=1 Tax=Nitratireductor sp. ZSWI3 TaxID=2966359 RepID=UPI00214FA649|nr:MFS transporter [Nitratireductor sp. ZSWI3]MCR4268151.1 MFS transporter [Nitratireductor sp. ZSWI3]